MKITSMEEYGLRCLVRVGAHNAAHGSALPISAQEVAEAEGISLPYAQKLLRTLCSGRLVDSTRGAQGGYVLARPADRISVGDAIRVLGGVIETSSICTRHTGDQETCLRSDECSIRPVWSYLSQFIVSTFDAIPLELLITEREGDVARHLMQLVPPRHDAVPSLLSALQEPG